MGREEESQAVAKHEPFVRMLAGQYVTYGIPFDDLLQEGLLAFVLAFRKWNENEEHTHAFTTFVGSRIRSALRQLVGRTKDADGTRRLQPREQHLSLDAPQPWGGCLHDVVGAPADQEQDCERAVIAERVRVALAKLPARDRRVIELRFGQECTLQAVADELDVSAERVRQIEKSTLRQLSTRLRAVAA